MKTIVLAVIFAMVAATLADAKPHHSESVQVQINTEKRTKSGIMVKFSELVEDSRCPTDTRCIWAGNAKIKVIVTQRGSKAKTIELDTMQRGDAPTIHGYKLRLTKLTPAPATNIRINRNGYVATIEFTKLPK